MDFKDYYAKENEKPLDRIVDDGGFCAIFRKIGCIGDSLSSGEFESKDMEGTSGWHDMFEYSWGQYMARAMGSTVYNFSRGGMSAEWFMRDYALNNGFFDPAKACQAYIIALGVNDMSAVIRGDIEFGSLEDIKADYRYNNKTFTGKYAAIIQRYKMIRPDAKFFLMTIPKGNENEERDALYDRHQKLIYDLAEMYDNMYVLDFRKYAPIYDEEFHKNFYLGGHLNAQGYIVTAKMVMSYIDYIVRHNVEDFRQVPFIGTPYINIDHKKM